MQLSGTVHFDGGLKAPVKRAFVNAAASATTEVVAAVSLRKIRVIALAVVAGDTATDLTFKSGSTAISCLFANAANGGELGVNIHGWFETAAGAALNVTTDTGSTTGVLVTYVEVV